jgi:hypothetical protein
MCSAESDAPLKGRWFMRGPRSPFRVSGGVFSCGVWDLSDSGADVRLNSVPLLPIESTFRSTASHHARGPDVRDSDIAGIAFRPTTTANSNCS